MQSSLGVILGVNAVLQVIFEFRERGLQPRPLIGADGGLDARPIALEAIWFLWLHPRNGH